MLRNRGTSFRPSFIFKKITHAFYSKESVDKSEERITNVPSHDAQQGPQETKCIVLRFLWRRGDVLSSVSLTSIVVTVKEVLTNFPFT